MIKIKTLLSDARHWLINWGHKHKEYLSILVAFLLYLSLTPLVRGIDPTSRPVDPGYLSAIVMAVIAVLIFMSVTWWVIKSIWPVFADFFTDVFNKTFKSLTYLQKCVIALSVYGFIVCCFLFALYAFLQ